MTINICIIFLIIIGIILLIQSPIKKIYKENFTVASGGLPTGKGTPPGTGGDDIDEMNIPTITTNKEEKAKIENGYEIVGSIPPPSFRDEIYDHNLRDALQVWKDAGCKVTSKYAPNVDNKDNLLDMPLDAVISSVFFFYHLGKDLSVIMNRFLKQELTKAPLHPQQDSMLNGGGIKQFSHSLKGILEDLNISPN